MRCRPLTLEVIASCVVWPQEDWNFCRIRSRRMAALPPGAVIPDIPPTAACYAEVCLRTRSLELVHNGRCGADGSAEPHDWDTPRQALIYDILHAPSSLRRVRFELVTLKGAPSQCGTLSMSSRVELSNESGHIQTVAYSEKLRGTASMAHYLRTCCADAGLSVGIDMNAVTVSRQ